MSQEGRVLVGFQRAPPVLQQVAFRTLGGGESARAPGLTLALTRADTNPRRHLKEVRAEVGVAVQPLLEL